MVINVTFGINNFAVKYNWLKVDSTYKYFHQAWYISENPTK